MPIALAACSAAISSVKSRIWPLVPGYWNSAPNTLSGSNSDGSATITSMPSGSARVLITAIFCGWQAASTKNAPAFDFATRCAMVIASAQAVASSSSEAPATSSPVRSEIIVW